MRLKLFRAATTREAMSQIRAELGDEALILSTRKVADGVEITTAWEPPNTSELPACDPASTRQLNFHGTPPSLVDRLARGNLAETLAVALRFAPLAVGAGARPMMFVGPPGAGKTLTVARLATRLVMAGAQPLVITADGRRAGAAEQLAAFTRLLGLDLVVASHPVTLARALARRVNGAPVLIDLPATSPFDPIQHDEIADLAATANARLALVLPAGMDVAEATEIATGFGAMGAEYLIATRLDVARRLGSVLAAASAGLGLAEAGIGPGAADGLVNMTPEFLSQRLLQQPQHPERHQ
jgi:flagellar biosynthesis protein FlhF